MRRLILCALVSAVALSAAPTAARASDASVRDTVVKQATRQAKEDARFIKAMQHLSTKKGLKKASAAAGRQAASVKLWHDALRAEQADTQKVRTARLKMLNALNLYTTGLRKLQHAIRQALHAGGATGYDRAKAAFQNLTTATKKVRAAARAMA
jgi:hypothetical protein